MELSDPKTLFSRDNTHGILASILDWFNCGTVRAKRDYDLTIINYPVYFWQSIYNCILDCIACGKEDACWGWMAGAQLWVPCLFLTLATFGWAIGNWFAILGVKIGIFFAAVGK